LVNAHHIASDGWSMDIFQRELLGYYEAWIKKDITFDFAPLSIQYKDYAVWQKSYLQGEVMQQQATYWKEKLSGFETLELPADYPRPEKIDYRGSGRNFYISETLSKQLIALARENGVSLYSLLLSAFHILLGRYTGREDIITGSPIANRHHAQTEGLIGFFVNTMVNRTQLSGTQSFKALMQQVHREQVQAQQHQDLPFEKLVEELGVERDLSRHPVFQVMFGVQSFGNEKKALSRQNQYLKPFALTEAYPVERFDLSLFVDDSEAELKVQASYAVSLFKEEMITQLAGHYIHLLSQLAAAPDALYSRINLLSAAEQSLQLSSWNNTEKPYPDTETIHGMFEDQAAKHPGSTALVYEGQTLSYGELNERSNALARHIRKSYQTRTGSAMPPDTLIALLLERSLEMVV
ncbi:condensation domain-containing protein, partial [Mucilaginibacter calamicampi]